MLRCFFFLSPLSPLRMALLAEVVVCHHYREDAHCREGYKVDARQKQRRGKRGMEQSLWFDHASFEALDLTYDSSVAP